MGKKGLAHTCVAVEKQVLERIIKVSDTFDKYSVSDSGDAPIYDKETLDSIIGDNVTFEDVKTLVESK